LRRFARFDGSDAARRTTRDVGVAGAAQRRRSASRCASGTRLVAGHAVAMQERDDNVLEAEKTRLKPPPLYKVILLNDDYTPMDFVVVVLQTVFAMNREKATQVMLQIHREGMGVCGTYTREVAAAKVDQVLSIARRHQHPLQCTMEET
jgi:ATP-dependent Clp protease adaptor protein ClpS